MSKEQWIEMRRNLGYCVDFFADGSLVLIAGVVILFIMLGWSHIFFLAWFSAHRILYTGLWILFSVVVLGWIAREA